MYLVIGCNSFSGSWFVNELLKNGEKVIGISRSGEPNDVYLPFKWEMHFDNYRFIKLDLNNNLDLVDDILNKYKIEYVVNFAAQGMVAESWNSPEDWYQTNVVSQVKLHDKLRKLSSLKKYVHVTTPEAYGSSDNTWIKENYNFAPSTPYAVSRAACDLHLLSFYKAYDFPVVFTRAANVFGPGQQLYRILPRSLISARVNKTFPLHGGGFSERAFIYIEDVVRATYKISQEGKVGETYHISTNNSLTIRDLVMKVCDITKVNFHDIVDETGERLGKDQSYLLNSSKLRKELDWSDQVTLEEGIEKTLFWIDKNLKWLSKQPFEYTHKK